jgi:hypothetical protein
MPTFTFEPLACNSARSVDRRDVDDLRVILALQIFEPFTDTDGGRHHVYVHGLAPVIAASVDQSTYHAGAGVVDEYVEGAQMLVYGRKQRQDVLLFGHVCP